MTRLWADARLALRSWRKAPAFTAIAILSVALGIGANAAIFTLIDQILLRKLPVHAPDELVQVSFTGSRYGTNWGDGTELSYPMYTDLRDHTNVFSGMFSRFGFEFQVGHANRTERVAGEIVSGSYFPVLGVGAAAGRTLGPEDDQRPGAHPVAVLSYGYWLSAFGGNPDVVNSTLTINGHPYTIVGVARRGFEGVELGRPTMVFVPMMMKAQVTPGWNALDERLYRWVRVFGRLQPGVSLERAQAALQPYFASLLQQDLADPGFARASEMTRTRYRRNTLAVRSAAQGRSNFRRTIATPLWVLMATAAGVLLIACANVANLLLARAAGRRREMAVRLALGATRRRIVEQLLVESLILATAGGLAGLAIAWASAPIVLGFFTSPETPHPVSTSPDWRILAFTFAVSTVTGILFGLAPAFQSARQDVAPTLKNESGTVVSGQGRVRKALVAFQLSLALLLVVGAALFIRTLDKLSTVDVGFDTTRLIEFGIDPSLNGYDSPRVRQLAKTLLQRLDEIPGVDGAGLATVQLLEGNQWSSDLTVDGYQQKPDESLSQFCNTVSPGYFKAMGIPLIAGRDFTERDERTAPPSETTPFRAAIVNERFARHYFGTANAIGRRIGFGGNPNTPTPIEIVGVVGDAKYTSVRDDVQRQVFFPYLEDSNPGGFTVYLRTDQPADRMFTAVREAIRGLDANLPVYGTRTLAMQVVQSLRNERLVAAMTTTFGSLATLLAVVGLYGVVSYSVVRRTREIGVRVAFGARATDIGWLVIREVLAIAGLGIAVGLPAAWWLARLVSTQLYGVKSGDLTAFASAVLLLAAVAVLAGLIPSARAARLDPTTALRHQ